MKYIYVLAVDDYTRPHFHILMSGDGVDRDELEAMWGKCKRPNTRPGKTGRRFRNNRPCDLHFPKSARDKTVVQFKEPEKATRADKIIPEIQETPC